MPSGTDRFSRERMLTTGLRKAASVADVAGIAARRVQDVGHTVWGTAKTLGGGPVGGAALLGGGALAASATLPQMVSSAKETYDTVSNPQTALARGGMK